MLKDKIRKFSWSEGTGLFERGRLGGLYEHVAGQNKNDDIILTAAIIIFNFSSYT